MAPRSRVKHSTTEPLRSLSERVNLFTELSQVIAWGPLLESWIKHGEKSIKNVLALYVWACNEKSSDN